MGGRKRRPSPRSHAIFNNFPALDVGYTYPDINNAFLAYIANEPVTGNLIVTPSFHRPALLRDASGNAAYQLAIRQFGKRRNRYDDEGPARASGTRLCGYYHSAVPVGGRLSAVRTRT